MTRAALNDDEPVAYRVVVKYTVNGLPRTLRLGPYGTKGAARGVATSESGSRYWRDEPATVTVEAIRAEAWEAVQ